MVRRREEKKKEMEKIFLVHFFYTAQGHHQFLSI